MPNKDRLTAFVIVCWNNQPLLDECLKSISEQTATNHITILVDNGSADNSPLYVKQHFPWVRIIEAGENLGFAKGNNLAINQALKDEAVQSVVLLNTDARLAPTWLEIIQDFLANKPKAACLQGTTLDYYNHEVIDSTHVYISQNGQGTQGNWRKIYEADFGPKKVFGVNAAACLITRSFIEAQPFKNELFDESFFMYLEDVDICARATVMGWDNYTVAKARAYHMGSVSSGKNPGFSLYMTFRNNAALLYKNLPLTTIIKITPRLVKGDIEVVKTLYKTERKSAIKKVIKGRLLGLVRLPLYMAKRRKIKQHLGASADYVEHLMTRGY